MDKLRLRSLKVQTVDLIVAGLLKDDVFSAGERHICARHVSTLRTSYEPQKVE